MENFRINKELRSSFKEASQEGRFKRTGSMEDLDRAISVASDALDATPLDHPDRAGRLNNLGNWLGSRFERTGCMDDLNRAVSVASDAVDATPLDHPDRAGCLNNLGNRLGMRFERTGSMDDLNRGLASYTEGWNCISAPPSLRIRSAQLAARILISQQKWGQSYQLLQDAIFLLPTVSPRSLNRSDVQASTATFFGLASTAAAAALNAGKTPEDALQLLELGRGVIASLLMDMRGDITDLRQGHPDLAEKFILLRDELDSPTHNVISPTAADEMSSWELQAKRRREADREFSDVIDTIRAQPRFSNFLHPPTAEELMSATDKGPIVVVNISWFRCDAILIQPGSIQVVALPNLNQAEVRQRVASLSTNSNLSPVLEWLWLVVCHPILNALGLDHTIANDDWPHIWWVPTGLLSQLPLHAAGIHTQATRETVLDRAISSYASSIKALLHGRKHGMQQLSQTSIEASALMVAMQETPGLGERERLEFANVEVEMLRQLCPQLHLAPTEPSRHKDEILTHLSNCKIFHFAGHGNSDPKDPSRSCLLLDDWETNPLTVEEVRDSRLQDSPPFLAYLSACSTGANRAATLADEGIHLISAFQLAGFRHVVGTLWEVSDEHCVDAAKILYETLQEEGITDEAVGRGLHQAVTTLWNQSIRDGRRARDFEFVYSNVLQGDMIDYSWVPYVHFGV
ncbi:CHAT domain-containing protein [Trichoderma austrokoningii]